MREITGRVIHPEFLGDLQRVHHPELNVLTNGEPVLGWAGDPRLAVYTNGKSFVLYRLEHDEEYRPVCVIQGKLGQDTMNRLIVRLVEIDGRTGWNAEQSIAAEETAHEEARQSDQMDFLVDFADKFQFGLARSHLPGVDVTKKVYPLSEG